MAKFQDYIQLMDIHPHLFQNSSNENEIRIVTEIEQIKKIENQMKKKLQKKGLPESYSKIGVVYKDQYLYILRDAVVFPGGEIGSYIRCINIEDYSTGVAILPIYKEEVVLVRHFRHATRSWEIEIPRGFGEKGYSDKENALRELREEINGEVRSIIDLGIVNENSGITAGFTATFYAELNTIGVHNICEGIERIILVTLDHFKSMISSGEIRDAFTLTTYAKAVAAGYLH